MLEVELVCVRPTISITATMTKTVIKKSERKIKRQSLLLERRCLFKYCRRGVSRSRECCHWAYESSTVHSDWYGGGAVYAEESPPANSISCEIGRVLGEYGGRWICSGGVGFGAS